MARMDIGVIPKPIMHHQNCRVEPKVLLRRLSEQNYQGTLSGDMSTGRTIPEGYMYGKSRVKSIEPSMLYIDNRTHSI